MAREPGLSMMLRPWAVSPKHRAAVGRTVEETAVHVFCFLFFVFLKRKRYYQEFLFSFVWLLSLVDF